MHDARRTPSTLRARLRELERRAAGCWIPLRDLSTRELEARIVKMMGYLPDTEEMVALVAELDEGDAA